MTSSDRSRAGASVVASIHDRQHFRALDRMLEQSRFFDVLEDHRAASAKPPEDFLIAVKPNFMMGVKVERPSLVYTDPALVEHWLGRLRQAGYGNLRVVEAQNVYSLWYHNRSVVNVARTLGFSANGYEVRDLTNEQFPYDYGGTLGNTSSERRGATPISASRSPRTRPTTCRAARWS